MCTCKKTGRIEGGGKTRTAKKRKEYGKGTLVRPVWGEKGGRKAKKSILRPVVRLKQGQGRLATWKKKKKFGAVNSGGCQNCQLDTKTSSGK